MIEYVLLFGLGFLCAILAVLMLAPAIHRRVVKFTEDRILATVPVSPQELRAQKDMVRAEMATLVARTGHDLKLERQRAAQLSIANDQLSAEAGRLYGESADLRNEMQEMQVQASELRASLRNEEIRLEQMRTALSSQESSERAKDGRIEEMLHRIQRMAIDADNLRIDISTRDTEAEGLKARINALRDERDTLRNDLRLATQRAKDAELRLAREENRANRLEERLNSEVSGSIDKDTIIERRVSEINRLKERLKTANAEAREVGRQAKSTTSPRVQVSQRVRNAAANADERRGQPSPPLGGQSPADPAATPALPQPRPARIISSDRATELTEIVRAQAAAAADDLLVTDDPSRDDAMRGELADIAAKMIAIVGQKEGASSPIRSMVSARSHPGREDRVSLAERASRLIHQD